MKMERYVVVDNSCGWPKLTLMDDGSINLDVHNKPIHGSRDGSTECWKSTDAGKTFSLFGVSGKGSNENGAYMDRACGIANNGDYIVIVENRIKQKTVTFRSNDGGKNFDVTDEIYANGKPMRNPYGIIQRLGGKKLVYHFWKNCEETCSESPDQRVNCSYISVSNDDGYTWEDYLIDKGINETAILFYDELNGIAVGRIDDCTENSRDGGAGNRIYRTKDGGKSWAYERNILAQGMIPTHLLKLHDGKTLMTFGFRFTNKYGVMAAVSEDDGKSFSTPNIITEFPGGDGGYPSTVQTDDGTLVTAYYCSGHMYHTRYHVAVVRWHLNELIEHRWVDGRGPCNFFYGTDKECVYNWRV